MKIPGDRAIALPRSQGFGRKIPDHRTPSAGKKKGAVRLRFQGKFLQNALQKRWESFSFGCEKSDQHNWWRTENTICCLGFKIETKKIIYMKKIIPPKKRQLVQKIFDTPCSFSFFFGGGGVILHPRVWLVLLMVQKSQGQPSWMYVKTLVNDGDFNYQLPSTGAFTYRISGWHQQYDSCWGFIHSDLNLATIPLCATWDPRLTEVQRGGWGSFFHLPPPKKRYR